MPKKWVLQGRQLLKDLLRGIRFPVLNFTIKAERVKLPTTF